MCFHPQGIPRYNKQDIGLTGKKYLGEDETLSAWTYKYGS